MTVERLVLGDLDLDARREFIAEAITVIESAATADTEVELDCSAVESVGPRRRGRDRHACCACTRFATTRDARRVGQRTEIDAGTDGGRRGRATVQLAGVRAGYDLFEWPQLRRVTTRRESGETWRAVTTNDHCAIARRWDVTSGSAWLLRHYRGGREERSTRTCGLHVAFERSVAAKRRRTGTERTSRPSVSPRNGDRDAPTLHGPQCQCRNAATRPPRRGTLRAKALVFYDTNEVGRTRYDPTLRAPGRGTKRRIGGRRSPSIVRLLDGKVLGGNGQGSATSRRVGAPPRHSMPGVPTSLGAELNRCEPFGMIASGATTRGCG